MSEYFVTGTDGAGRRVTERIQATSVDDAVQIARARGMSDVVLHDDDIMAALSKPDPSGEVFTPKESLIAGRGSYFARVVMLSCKAIKTDWWTYAVLGVLFAARRAFQYSFNWIDWIVLAYAAHPFFVFAFTSARRPSKGYDALLELELHARWQDLLERLPQVEPQLPPHEVRRLRSRALAGLGRMDQALREMQPLQTSGEIPEWLYWSLISDLYGGAHDYTHAIQTAEYALQLAPKNPTLMLSLAGIVLPFTGEVARAEQLLRDAQEHAMSELLQFAVAQIAGMIAVERRQPEQAVALLNQSQRELRQLPQNPLLEAARAKNSFYLALAYNQLGQHDRALHEFRLAAPCLRAHQLTELLDRARQEIGPDIQGV
jgi:tetratricopeptide (TPR) repeat protein